MSRTGFDITTKRRSIAPFLILIVALYLLFSVALVFQFYRQERARRMAELWQTSEAQRTAIDRFFSERRSELLLLSRMISIEAPSGAQAVARIEALIKAAFPDHPGTTSPYAAFYYFNSDGRLLINRVQKYSNQGWIRDKTVGTKLLEQQFDRAFNRPPHSVFTSDIVLHHPDKNLPGHYEPVLYLATPIFENTGEERIGRRIGLIASELRLSAFLRGFKQAAKDTQSTLLIANNRGSYIVHSAANKEWGLELDTGYSVRNDFSQHNADLILSGKPGSFEEVEGIFGVFVPTFTDIAEPQNPWLMVIRLSQPKATIALLAAHRTAIFYIIVIFIMVLALLWYFYIRYLSTERRLFRTQTDFIAILTHDLRSPLATIKASIDLLASGKYPPDKFNDILKVANNVIYKMGLVINNFLDLSKYESGKMTVALSAGTLKEVVDTAARSFETRAADKGVRLTVSADPNLPNVMMDADKIERAVINLIDNALKFTGQGGSIQIQLSRGKSSYVTLLVSDTGTGIPPDELPKVFSKYEQVQDGQKSGGTGLGLPIVKQIVEAHHGKIHVESGLGEGTTFMISLRST